MAIQEWSDDILVVDLNDDPAFTDEMTNLSDRLEQQPADVVLNLSAVSFINSSNVAKLLRLRKLMMHAHRRLILCGVNSQVGGVFAVTGLDKIYEFTDDMATALATLQIYEGEGEDLE